MRDEPVLDNVLNRRMIDAEIRETTENNRNRNEPSEETESRQRFCVAQNTARHRNEVER